jgi:hypothetical protein
MMKPAKTLGLATLAMFALSAVIGATAQARSGPYYKINKGRLSTGEKEEMTSTAQTPLVLTAVGITITCSGMKFKTGAEIIGSSGENSSTSKETIELEECVLTGNGTKCRLAVADKGIIKTEPVKDTLAYPKKVPVEGDVELVLFQPESGAVFANPAVEAEAGGKCTVTSSIALEGSMVAEAQNEKGEPFKVLEKVTETVTGLMHFPVKGTEACTEKTEAITCIKPKLTLSTKNAKLEGTVGLTLISKNVWGVFSEIQARGPYYKINKGRLSTGEKEEMTSTAQTPLVLTAVGITITCSGMKFKTGAEIIGSSGENSSTSKETIELEECVLTGNGTKCRLAVADKGIIKTEPVKDTLAYPKKVPVEGDVELVLFQPESGAVFANPAVEAEAGGKCTVTSSIALEGSMVAEAQNEKGEPFKVLEKVTETVTGLMHFPVKGTEACTEKTEAITCIKPKLTLSTKNAKLEGTVGLTLISKNVWGVFSERD